MGKELGTYLRGMRSDAKLTATALAKAAGLSKSMITSIELGTRDPGFAVMLRYVTAIGVKDITPVLEVYLKDQAISALPELEGTGAAHLIRVWFDNQLNTKEVLSVDIAKLLPLLDSLDRVSGKLHKVCGQVKNKNV